MYTVKYQFFIQFFTTVLSCILAECQSSGEDISQNFLLFACTQTFFFRCFSNSCSPENLLGEIIAGRKEILPAITQSSQMGMGMFLLTKFPPRTPGAHPYSLSGYGMFAYPPQSEISEKGWNEGKEAAWAERKREKGGISGKFNNFPVREVGENIPRTPFLLPHMTWHGENI